MAETLMLPQPDGSLRPYPMWATAASYSPPAQPLQSRIVYAAAHVVPAAAAAQPSGSPAQLDWELTLAYRRHLWAYGLGVAEAMDTAQRGMGLDWAASRELIRRSLAEARQVGGRIACGVGTDQLPPHEKHSLETIASAYEEQLAFVQGEGGRVILMASRALAASARHLDEYAWVYERILRQAAQPVILHWLGDMFDPALAGYWGATDLDSAMDNALQIISANAAAIDGIKLSLLDAEREIQMRARLPEAVRMYTGDDFNYPALILGDGQHYSHALLGIFDAIAPAASAAIQALDAGDEAASHAILEATVPLARHIFAAPTYHYKTGIVFMAYLNGHQPQFRMVGGQESARDILYLAALFQLADQAGLLHEPALAAARMKALLAAQGIEA